MNPYVTFNPLRAIKTHVKEFWCGEPPEKTLFNCMLKWIRVEERLTADGRANFSVNLDEIPGLTEYQINKACKQVADHLFNNGYRVDSCCLRSDGICSGRVEINVIKRARMNSGWTL